MSVFFKAESLRSVVAPALAAALATDPKGVADLQQAVAQQASQIVTRVTGTFSWLRLAVALALLALLFLGALYTGRDTALQAVYNVLVHGLELGIGGVLALLVGEAATRG
jgi:hypothetical protein